MERGRASSTLRTAALSRADRPTSSAGRAAPTWVGWIKVTCNTSGTTITCNAIRGACPSNPNNQCLTVTVIYYYSSSPLFPELPGNGHCHAVDIDGDQYPPNLQPDLAMMAAWHSLQSDAPAPQRRRTGSDIHLDRNLHGALVGVAQSESISAYRRRFASSTSGRRYHRTRYRSLHRHDQRTLPGQCADDLPHVSRSWGDG